MFCLLCLDSGPTGLQELMEASAVNNHITHLLNIYFPLAFISAIFQMDYSRQHYRYAFCNSVFSICSL